MGVENPQLVKLPVCLPDSENPGPVSRPGRESPGDHHLPSSRLRLLAKPKAQYPKHRPLSLAPNAILGVLSTHTLDITPTQERGWSTCTTGWPGAQPEGSQGTGLRLPVPVMAALILCVSTLRI